MKPNVIFVSQSAKLIAHAGLKAVSHAEETSFTIAQIIADSARVSTKKPWLSPTEAKKFVEGLMRRGHWSPFEFFDVTFEVVTSRAVSHELVRHRLASYIQESQRYCRYDDKLPVIRRFSPSPQWPEDLVPIFARACNAAHESYLDLLTFGVRPEDARVVLPEATATKIRVKMNLREFRHFLYLRTDKAAWFDMRMLASQMADAFVSMFPTEQYLIDDCVRCE